jgi:hypothetical protein
MMPDPPQEPCCLTIAYRDPLEARAAYLEQALRRTAYHNIWEMNAMAVLFCAEFDWVYAKTRHAPHIPATWREMEG